jgi:3',5'-cyclic AMP phosphodiesterase CpdA
MLFLHLSDIHFRASEIATAQDPNRNLRNEIIRDAKKFCEDLDKIPEGILVSGDIAYAGQRTEYEFAKAWLKDLAESCGTKLSAVFVCPGNHDVDRKLAGRATNRAFHHQIKTAESLTLQQVMDGLLNDEQSARILYEPLDEYNNFAGQFFCDMNAPDRTVVSRDDLRFSDGSQLKIWSVNTAWVSSAADDHDQLFIDTAALQIPREAGVENMVLFHHANRWLRNGQEWDDHMRAVARIQLTGHEHLARVEEFKSHVRLRAGALHPERSEPNWLPGYNLFEVDIEEIDGRRVMNLDVHVRIWSPALETFQAQASQDGNVWKNTFSLEPWTPPVSVSNSPEGSSDEPSVEDALGLATMNAREIGIAFFGLSYSRKLEIAGRLNLMDESDMNQPDYERFRRVFKRAAERRQLSELEAAIFEASGE